MKICTLVESSLPRDTGWVKAWNSQTQRIAARPGFGW